MTLTRKLLPFGLVFIAFLSLYFLASSAAFDTNSVKLSTLVTIDVILTIPLLYFLLIRKTNIPKLTTLPILFIGLVLASYIIPENQQTYLVLFKTYTLPVIELGVLGFIIYKLNSAIKLFKANKTEGADFYSILKKTCKDNLPNGIASLAVTEISVIYYGLIYWKKRELEANEFSYNKNSGTVGLFVVFIIIIAAETIGLHAWISKSYPVIAWILTILSIYTGFQILGFVKSIIKRPISIENKTLYLRYGIMKEAVIPLYEIDAVEMTSKDLNEASEIKKFSFLGDLEPHNLIIHFKTPQKVTSLYGKRSQVNGLALSIDDRERFIAQLEL